MQIDEKFQQAVSHVLGQLQASQLSQSQWIDTITTAVNVPVTSAKAIDPKIEYPGSHDVTDAFSTEGIKDTINQIIAGSSDDLSLLALGEMKAASLQTQMLLELQRYYARKKQSRLTRIVNASHRRAILTQPQGPITGQLVAAIENHLALIK